jgi:hypothetical protein
MDVSDKARYYIEKKERNVAKWGTPKKVFKKKVDLYRKGSRSGYIRLDQVREG